MILRWFPSIVWMGFIFYSSSQEGPSAFPVPDYVSHFVVYFILAGLYHFALLGVPLTASSAWARFLAGLLLTAVYGWSDEFHQSFVSGRDSSPVDLAVDIFAGMSALGLWELVRRVRAEPAPVEAPDESP